MSSDHSVERTIIQRLMLAFEGVQPPAEILAWLAALPPAGFTLFRHHNVEDPGQVRDLTATLQAAAAKAGATGELPLLIAADQEGGQLVALGDGTTAFPGNMALGATGDADLAWRVGHALGRELAAMGVNVAYGPVCDVNTNPRNPNVGVRAFGDDPALVAALAVAVIDGLQAAGVAATAKHFPGNGDSELDPHDGVPVLNHDLERLREVELPPFQAAIDAGVRLVMTGHVGIPALTGDPKLPATVSRAVMHDLLRGEMGFSGTLISDAFDMRAISQGDTQIVDAIAALRAGVDLLLLPADPEVRQRIYDGLCRALSRRLLDGHHLQPSQERILALKRWLAGQEQPDLAVVGCAEHRRLEREVARRAVTLARDRAGLLPLRLPADAAIAAIMPEPRDLTPADTSSYVRPALASALRAYQPRVDEFITSHSPTAAEIAALRERATEYDLLVVGTVSTHLQPDQGLMVRDLLNTGIPAITVALRTPYDLPVYPQSETHLCTYSLQPCALEALAAAMWDEIPFQGKLPVSNAQGTIGKAKWERSDFT
jgi:beta-N-acetylhexosaminidase